MTTYPDDVVEKALATWFSNAPEVFADMTPEYRAQMMEDMRHALAAAEAAMWRPIGEIGEHAYGTPVLVDAPGAHRGIDSMEVCVVCPDDDGTVSYWTNGGPNGGSDFEIDPPPTRFRLLPTPPAASTGRG